MKKTIFLTILFLIFSPVFVEAGASDNVSGWAWSNMDDSATPADESSIGWISFNSINCDADSDGKSDGAPAGCPATGTSISDYGVNINADGTFSGYAWSENIGWIDFAPSSGYPNNPKKSAEVNLDTKEISGWARALSYGGGWDGWIKLRNHPSESIDYGVYIDDDNNFQSWAWGSDIVGWISFKGTNYGPITTFPFIPPNSPPDKPLSLNDEWENCEYKGKSLPVLSWSEFQDDDEDDAQTAYEIRIDDNSGFSNDPDPTEFRDSGGAATSYTPSHRSDEWAGWMDWGQYYWWVVRVKDDKGNWSEWSDVKKFDEKSPNHAYPYPGFSWLPEDPNQKEVVVFTPDESDLYYSWTIPEGEGEYADSTGPTNEEPHIKFLTADNKVKLEVTDDDAYSCESEEHEITAQLPLPEYKEVPPIIWLRKMLAGLYTFIFF